METPLLLIATTNNRIKNIEARAGGFDTTEGEYRFGWFMKLMKFKKQRDFFWCVLLLRIFFLKLFSCEVFVKSKIKNGPLFYWYVLSHSLSLSLSLSLCVCVCVMGVWPTSCRAGQSPKSRLRPVRIQREREREREREKERERERERERKRERQRERETQTDTHTHMFITVVPSGGVTLKRRCTYRPSVIFDCQ
jgi:hypothetical protein